MSAHIHKLSQRQIQTLRLSPQQVLYTKLLQLPVLQMEQYIDQQLEENPFLEEQEEPAEEQELGEAFANDQPSEPDTLDVALHQAITNNTVQSPTETTTSENGFSENQALEKKEEEKTVQEEENDFDVELAEALSNDDSEGYKVKLQREPNDDERDYLQPTYEENFLERLLAQLHLLDLSEKELRIAEEIIGNLDSDGYLRCSFDVIQDGLLTVGIQVNEKEIEAVLEKVWTLDPPGIGARNLQECLLIQLATLAKEDLDDEHEQAIRLAQKILNHHYNDLTMKRYEKLLQDLACSSDELKRAITLIQKLNPKPGGDAPSQIGNYVIPDFTISFNGQDLILTSNERMNIQVRLSKRYTNVLKDKSQPEETKEFLRQRFLSAKSFITAMQMRQNTIKKVLTALMKRQYDFFVYGKSKLKPMILKDIAEDTQLDIATVSRVVNGKYVQTDFGVFELKYFFTTAMETESGDEISNRIIKQAIKDFIEKEESGKPLSDDKLTELLNERGFKVARRTVTKYREQLGIPVARLRRKIESISDINSQTNTHPKVSNNLTHL